MRSARSVNPATGAIIAEHPLSTDGEIAAALDRVQSAQREFQSRAADATSSLSGLSIAIPLLTALAAVLGLLGVRQRLQEYR